MTEPRIGAFGLVRTGGLGGWVIRVGTRSTVNHCVVYLGGGRLIEATPNGAAFSTSAKYRNIIWSDVPMTDAQASAIASWAEAQQGVPYGWLDIAALALACIGIRSRWVARRIEDSHYLICSQLADKAYQTAGVHLFTDGRLPGQVTPGDLLRLITSKGWVLS